MQNIAQYLDQLPSAAAALSTRASVFAALGDETRLGLLAKLTNGEPQSIARLTSGTRLTRQAVTKHLRVLEEVGVVFSVNRAGRESRFALDPKADRERADLSRACLPAVGQRLGATEGAGRGRVDLRPASCP